MTSVKAEMMHICIVLCTAVALQLSLSGEVLSQARSEGQKKKCDVYERSWKQAQSFFKNSEITPAFAAGNEAFIQAECRAGVKVCPQSAIDIEIANRITIATMNAGAASTFVSFHCK